MTNNIPDDVLKKYARMASEAFMQDPNYINAAKNIKLRKLVAYHATLVRLYASRAMGFKFYFDEQDRGVLIVRPAQSDIPTDVFMKGKNIPAVILLLPWIGKMLQVDVRCENAKHFDDKTYIISPVFVDVNHQGQGVARKLIEKAAADLKAQGYKLGLDTQNPENIIKYEKMGFKLFHQAFYEDTQMYIFHMILE